MSEITLYYETSIDEIVTTLGKQNRSYIIKEGTGDYDDRVGDRVARDLLQTPNMHCVIHRFEGGMSGRKRSRSSSQYAVAIYK